MDLSVPSWGMSGRRSSLKQQLSLHPYCSRAALSYIKPELLSAVHENQMIEHVGNDKKRSVQHLFRFARGLHLT